jgi:hypothetical protein
LVSTPSSTAPDPAGAGEGRSIDADQEALAPDVDDRRMIAPAGQQVLPDLRSRNGPCSSGVSAASPTAAPSGLPRRCCRVAGANTAIQLLAGAK